MKNNKWNQRFKNSSLKAGFPPYYLTVISWLQKKHLDRNPSLCVSINHKLKSS